MTGVGVLNSYHKSHYEQLPQGWAWCRLSDVAIFAGGKTPSTDNPDFWNGSVNWVTSKDMKSKYIDATQTKMSELGAEQMQLYHPNTLLMVVRSGILRRTLPLAILKTVSTVNQDLKAISFFLSEICEYCYYYFTAIEKEILTKYQKDGTTVESINFEDFKDIYFPLPPLTEQHRIVNAIESAFAVLDEIERNKADLQTAVTTVKLKILSLAIRGKLVPQDPNDEPASVLLNRIRAERETLAKAGKIKRGKSESSAVRSCDISYYNGLPESWVLCTLDDVGVTKIGLTYKPSEICTDGTPVLRSSNIKDGILDYMDLIRVNTVFSDSLELSEGDILICARNGSKHLVGKCALIPKITEKMTFGAFMAVYRSECSHFIYHFMNSHFFRRILESEGTSTQVNQLTQDMIKETVIPLPPIAEHKRIVTAIEAAFVQLDNITVILA